MIYPDNFEKKIGFDSVRTMVREKCSSPLGVKFVDSMDFTTDFDEMQRRLNNVAEFVRIINGNEAFPSGGIKDVTDRLKEIRPEGTYLTGEELRDLGMSISTMTAIESFFRSRCNDDGVSVYPHLSAVAADMKTFPVISRLIGGVVDRWGRIMDSASPELGRIRQSIARMGGSIASVMRRVISNAVREGILESDTTASVRDGRLVIPVAPMNKRRIAGIVHDESASGKTVFIEPAEVVEANNRLRELQMEERREEIRILVETAAQIRPWLNELEQSFETLGHFDFIRAKALWALEIDATMPNISDGPTLEWYHACHPVLLNRLALKGKEIVPLNIELTSERRILVVSGPNAGGKSVALKTVAIIQYMTQCGLLPAVYENSHISMFDNIFIDIGDDQSIEDDLSTYSSHLKNMKAFLACGNSRTLFMIDEFGSGTEPQIGGAIAQALLEEFNAKGMWGVVTTHFQNLKKFAGETPGLVNGSMLYERSRMQPLFQLAIGHPGSSFAVEIARNIGLPDKIISAAGNLVGSDYLDMDKYLLDIARDRRYWENKRLQIKQKEKRIDQELERYETEADNLRARRREIIDQAKDEAKKILDSSNAAIERTISEIRKAQAEREATLEARRKLKEDRRKLAEQPDSHPDLLKKHSRRKDTKSRNNSAQNQQEQKKELKVGDNVLLDGSGTPGTIEEIRGKEAIVIFGQIKTTVRLDRLVGTIRKPSSGVKKPTITSSAMTEESRQRQLRFSQEIDVRGMRVDEAVQAVTYFIDDAVQFNARRVRILHGTGTGALRQYIRQYLATVPSVVSYADEDVRLGGAGITVVDL